MLFSEAKTTLRLSLPIILGELTQMSLGIINSAMVGHLSYRHLAAASLVNGVMNIPYVFGIGMTMSVSQMVATARGRGERQKISHYLFNGFVLCLLTALAICVFLELIHPVFHHLGQDKAVVELSLPYFRLMALSVLPMLAFMALKQFTDGLEMTKTAMVLSMLSMPVNVFLDWILIYGKFGLPRMELIGAAVGTLTTRMIIFVALLLIILVHPKFKPYIQVRKQQWFLRRKTLSALLHIGIPSSLQALLEVGAFAVSGIIVGTFGAVSLASHQIALQAASFTFMVSMGLAQGSAIRIGSAFGAKDYSKIRSIGKSSFYTGLVYGILCAVMFICLKYQVPLLFNSDPAVIQVSAHLLMLAGIFQISDATQAIAVGNLRGLKDVKAPTVYMTLGYWILGIPVGLLLAYVFQWGVYGIWTGFVIGLSVVSVLLNRRFEKISRN